MNILNRLNDIFQESEIKEDSLYFPDYSLTVRSEVGRLTDNAVVLNFYLSCPEWDKELYECCVGMSDTQENALGMAICSFAFGIMDGIKKMRKDEGYCCGSCSCEVHSEHLESQYAGNKHSWKVYQSDMIGIGEIPTNTLSYWQLISDGIAKRIGNQKLNYVKIFASKNGDDITGECRLNDEMIPELSEKIAEAVKAWPTNGFGSQKMFVFLLQDAATYIPYPYKAEDFSRFTKVAVDLFGECYKQEKYETFVEQLGEKIGDRNLAQELYMFLPEICAQNAFDEMNYGEEVAIYFKDQQVTVYKSQLASYYAIQKALYNQFNSGAFSNELYKAYVSVSSIYGVISDAKKKNVDLEKGGKVFISFGADDSYELR